MERTVNGVVRTALVVLGCSTFFAGVLNFALGPDSAALTFARLLGALGFDNVYTPGALAGADADSEIRHFAVFLAAYGIWVLRVSLRRVLVRNDVLIALALFWAGGFGRVISIFQTGLWPDPLFAVLGSIELIGPLVLGAMFLLANSKPDIETEDRHEPA